MFSVGVSGGGGASILFLVRPFQFSFLRQIDGKGGEEGSSSKRVAIDTTNIEREGRNLPIPDQYDDNDKVAMHVLRIIISS